MRLIDADALKDLLETVPLTDDGGVDFNELMEYIDAQQDVPDTNVGDTISRQAAVDMFQNLANDDWNKDTSTTWANAFAESADMIEDLPAAQPQLIRCRDCKYYHSHYCGIWSQYGTIRTKEDGYCYMAERATE